MNVYQRPLFRQMGGPVAPGMAAQEAMAPMAGGQDPSAMLQQVEGMAAQQTQGLGAQYAQEMLAGIDRAETPEQIINALRGNEAPLQQRYAELAQFVGDADAQRTPESVLALVQPTIMMTEQGVLDSGIGELMQSLVGQVEMETESGAPTPMGQGVGSLMMAGAPAAPEMGVGQQPVANFSQGGVVQRFQTGGEASRLQALYSEMLPVYQGILGDGGEQQRLTQAQILFDIADRAGAFAAGIDPRTGQSMARLSPAAQLAGALSGLGGQIGERLGSQEEQDRALRLAALQAAQGEYSAERAAARAASGRERGIGDAYEAVDAEGNVIATEFLANRDDLEAFQAANPGATIRQAREPSTDFGTTTFYSPTGDPVTVVTTTPEGRAQAAALLAQNYTAVAPPAAGDQVVLLNPQNLEDSIVVEAGTPAYSQALREGYRTLADIEAQRELTQPGELVTYVNPNDPNDRITATASSPEAAAALARGLLPVSDAATIAGMQPEPVEAVTYINPSNPADRVTAIPNSPEAAAALARGLVRTSEAAAIAGMQPEPVEPVTYVNPNDPNDRVTAVPNSPEAAAALARGLVRTSEAAAIAGLAPEPADAPATLIERQQAALTDQSTLDNLENLSPQALGLFAANAAAYIQETVGPAGVSSRLPLPPNTQEAMRRAYAAGVDFPGIDPTFFGAPLRPEDMQSMGLALLDINNVDLGAATGFVSTLARSINFLGEQVAEVAGGEGTVFTQTAEASGALNALAQATRRFYLEGRTLAKEFENLEREIPTFSGFLTDAAARRALERQRTLLEGEVARVMDVIENPRRYTNADISQARRMQVYASQLLATYDQFLQAYQGVNRRGPTPTYDDIMANPDYILND